MAVTAPVIVAADARQPAATDRLQAAERRLYDAEIALHIAHQTHVDAWIAAAAERLHSAVLEHRAALGARTAA